MPLSLDQMKQSFGSVTKPETFTDMLLDALMAEGGLYVAAIAAMRCKEVDQETILEQVGDSNGGYIQAIERRLEKEFDETDTNSIIYTLKNR